MILEAIGPIALQAFLDVATFILFAFVIPACGLGACVACQFFFSALTGE